MTMSTERGCLKYRMLGSLEEIGSWGHEYVRHLTGEISQEWQVVESSDQTKRDELMKMVNDVVPYLMTHNAEAEACDLLMEIEKLDLLGQVVEETSYTRVCLYLIR